MKTNEEERRRIGKDCIYFAACSVLEMIVFCTGATCAIPGGSQEQFWPVWAIVKTIPGVPKSSFGEF